MRDADVRRVVRSQLLAEHDGDLDTRIVEEMGVWSGAVRVDLAVINGELAGYEIKSARDTLTRLPSQAALYNMVFDRVHLVAAERHISHALDAIPEWWGIILAQDTADGVMLEPVRPGRTNANVCSTQLARLLWREEAISVLMRYHAANGVRSAAREKVVQRLAETLSLEVLRYEVRRCLKDRTAWLGQPIGDKRDVPVSGEA